jgi:hypothetical protein
VKVVVAEEVSDGMPGPAGCVTFTVTVEVPVAAGVPVIAPVCVEYVSPPGRPVISYVSGRPAGVLLAVGVTGDGSCTFTCDDWFPIDTLGTPYTVSVNVVAAWWKHAALRSVAGVNESTSPLSQSNTSTVISNVVGYAGVAAGYPIGLPTIATKPPVAGKIRDEVDRRSP